MVFPVDHSAKHPRHHFAEPLSEKDEQLVSSGEVTLDDGSNIAVEVFTDAPPENGTPRTETLKVEILTGDEAKQSHKTVEDRLERAEALQLDRGEGANRDYYPDWQGDLPGKRLDGEENYAPVHHAHHKAHHAGKLQHA